MNPEDRMIEDAGIPIREQQRQNQLITPSTQATNDHNTKGQGNEATLPPHAGPPTSYGPTRTNTANTGTHLAPA
eukprot:8618254-Heterocapsa_arctica.AAC.1